jgi:hypothetical protein
MTKMNFDGPVEVTPELMMALWDSMPESGQSGVSQLYFSRYVSGPISDQALVAGAKVIFEKLKLSATTVKKLRDAVGVRCEALVSGMNEAQAKSVMADELRKEMIRLAAAKAAELVAMIGLDDVRAMVIEASRKPVVELAHRYFFNVPEGQKRMLAMIDEVIREESEVIRDQIRAELRAAATPAMQRRLEEQGIAFDEQTSIESGHGATVGTSGSPQNSVGVR